jgi:adenosylcobinamide-phosphate synthase
MAAYKAVNTLDSMFGYKNSRYCEFGWWSARADDWANWLPARITGLLFAISASVWPGMSARRAATAMLRDAHRQPSPNSGYPEAAAAGALGVQLGGLNYYGGTASPKATLGEALRSLSWRCWPQMRALLYTSTLLFVATLTGVLPWR